MSRVFCRLFLSIDVVLVLLFVAGYAAYYVHPRHLWGLQLVALGLPLLSLALLLTTLGVAYCGSGRLLAVHGLVGVLLLIRFASLSGPAPAHAQDAHAQDAPALHVMTFNAGKYKYHKHDVAEDIAVAMRTLVEDTEAHLIGLQEGTAYHTQALTDALGYRRHPEEALNDSIPMHAFSRLEPEAHTALTLQMPSGAPYVAATRLQIRWQGQAIALYNLHLYSFNDKPWREDSWAWVSPAAWLERLRKYRTVYRAQAYEAEQVRRLLEQEALPFIVAGDFNTTPHNWGYQHLAQGLHDSFKIAGRGWGATYHTTLPVFRIDFILASPHWEVQAARTLRQVSSDHRPLAARLLLLRPGVR